jgi:ketosteroid isomerase-like protein
MIWFYRFSRLARSLEKVWMFKLRRDSSIIAVALVLIAGCRQTQKESNMLTPQETEKAIAALRAAYAAFNRGDIDAAVSSLDPRIDWNEPAEFPGGGHYDGVEGAKQYLTQSRAGAAEVISEPERFISSDDRIVVFVHARVLPRNSNQWQDIRLADVYTFRNGKAIQMRAFADRRDALHWVGLENVGP